MLVDAFKNSRSKPVKTPFGFSLIGDPSMEKGTFEPEETRLLSKLLPGVSTFVDVGANVGYYACLARSLGCAVVAIEPLPSNLKRLLYNLSLNGWNDTQVIPLGMGDTSGILELHGGGTGASLIGGWAGVSALNKQLVAVSSLDAVVRMCPLKGDVLVKVDVEGAELPMLRGARQLIARTPSPTWLIEICLTENHPQGLNPNFQATFELFWEQGYDSFTADEESRRVERSDVESWVAARHRSFGSYNFVFKRPQ